MGTLSRAVCHNRILESAFTLVYFRPETKSLQESLDLQTSFVRRVI